MPTIPINSVFLPKEKHIINHAHNVKINIVEHNFWSTIKYYFLFLWHLVTLFIFTKNNKVEPIYRQWFKNKSSVRISSRAILDKIAKHHRNDEIYFHITDENSAIKKMTTTCDDPKIIPITQEFNYFMANEIIHGEMKKLIYKILGNTNIMREKITPIIKNDIKNELAIDTIVAQALFTLIGIDDEDIEKALAYVKYLFADNFDNNCIDPLEACKKADTKSQGKLPEI